ncbi:MAG: FAD-binding oxidoreductase [Salinibacter sp.]|uniref:FAD-binding oxidoreductase n=1 Tax=Salinibacter sp. TaxID=2065818 RepID=UPI0035D4161B
MGLTSLFGWADDNLRSNGRSALSEEESTRFVPPPPDVNPMEGQDRFGWGFDDTEFVVTEDENIKLTGDRYDISGVEMPKLFPWFREVLQVDLRPSDVTPPPRDPDVPPPREAPALLSDLDAVFGADRMTQDDATRLDHGHGQTQQEIYKLNHGDGFARVPDLVVYPETDEEVERLVEVAGQHDAVLIPFGGGTNVTDALRCDPDEDRCIVSVDMRLMHRIEWIDPVNRTAKIQAGAIGRHIEEQLAEYGFTLGHEPDSIEFSTIGGWVATHASGMKKNRYGNIEDIVLDVEVVTPSGRLEKQGLHPRVSTGFDPASCLFGSEGNLGIITSVTVELFPRPETRRYGSVIFPTLDHGIDFLYDLAQTEHVPASVRLMDNMQFQFGRALQPEKEGLDALKSRLEKFYVTSLKGYDPERLVTTTFLFEGDEQTVNLQEETAYDLARQHGGMRAGAENGRRGYDLTFAIAYIRDLVFRYCLIGESFETAVPWGRAGEVIERVKRRTHQEHEAHGLPGRPFVTGRITQVYETGVCIYFYLAFYHGGIERPDEVFLDIEHGLREEILDAGGSLSHHHGVGKLRADFMDEIASEPTLDAKQHLKDALDPDGIFDTGNQKLRTSAS